MQINGQCCSSWKCKWMSCLITWIRMEVPPTCRQAVDAWYFQKWHWHTAGAHHTRKKVSTTMSKKVVVGRMHASVSIKKDSCSKSPADLVTFSKNAISGSIRRSEFIHFLIPWIRVLNYLRIQFLHALLAWSASLFTSLYAAIFLFVKTFGFPLIWAYGLQIFLISISKLRPWSQKKLQEYTEYEICWRFLLLYLHWNCNSWIDQKNTAYNHDNCPGKVWS